MLTNRRNRSHNLAELELVEDGGFTGGVKTNLRKWVNKVSRAKGSVLDTIKIPGENGDVNWGSEILAR